ncbi:sialidase family protein [Lachnoclostridium sp. Marseille-P6806]|uniref:sialidase family protein n=1 Tax=Lachnoclostridium sp. Marseille-P6806 TaxID=2364793 RepID=UPI001F5F3900|nr:sialidase family protein [Lachnoclostridium sp. Marseille-P6806]
MRNDGKLYHNNLLDTVEALIPNPYASCHASDLLELPNGDILCCWFAGSDEGNADISIALSRLNKGADQWTEPQIISDDPTRSEQNPSLFMAPNGDIWVIYTAQISRTPEIKVEFNLQYTAEIRRRISHDNGYTWGETSTMFGEPGSFCRQKIQVLSNGRWIFGNWMCFDDHTRNGSDITVFRISDDEGRSWRRVDLPDSAGRVHANIVETDNGRLICFFRSRFADNIWRSVSEDGGETWTAPVRTELPNNNSSISCTALQSGAIAVIYNHVKFNDDMTRTVWPKQRCPVAAAISDDGGVTWPYRRIIEPGEGFFGPYNDINNRRYEYPAMVQAADGTILTVYSWNNRSNIKFVAVDEKWIRGENLCRGAEDDPLMPGIY